MVFIDNKYTQWYYKIIDCARDRNLDNCDYVEKHHIIPESFYIERRRTGPKGRIEGDPDDPINIVSLTAREHYICHKLLTKMVEGCFLKKAIEAFWFMSIGNSGSQERYKINSREFEKVKKLLSQVRRDPIMSAEHRKKLSVANKGKKHSKEAIQKMSKSLRGKSKPPRTREHQEKLNAKRHLRHPITEDTRLKMSESAKKENLIEKVVFPHCVGVNYLLKPYKRELLPE